MYSFSYLEPVYCSMSNFNCCFLNLHTGFSRPYTKINSKWIKDLNVRSETVKLLEENTGRTLDDRNQSKILHDPPPRVMEIKTKVNKWDLVRNPLALINS